MEGKKERWLRFHRRLIVPSQVSINNVLEDFSASDFSMGGEGGGGIRGREEKGQTDRYYPASWLHACKKMDTYSVLGTLYIGLRAFYPAVGLDRKKRGWVVVDRGRHPSHTDPPRTEERRKR